MSELIALRQFDPLYIRLDLCFLVLLAALLAAKKQYAALIAGLLGGLLYMAVDYGIFHLLLHARSISGGHSLFWVLLWMSMSYGFTNFVWIWLWMDRDRRLAEWSLLILLWWFCCPLLTDTFGGAAAPIVIQRTTGAYHGYMAVLLFAGYLFLILWNLFEPRKDARIRILWLLAGGILVQFGWEAGLLLGGIRSAGLGDAFEKLRVLAVNSLLETNLGMPYLYFIYLAVTRTFTERLRRRPDPCTLRDRIAENNRRSGHGGS